jgi:hypothetical protein
MSLTGRLDAIAPTLIRTLFVQPPSSRYTDCIIIIIIIYNDSKFCLSVLEVGDFHVPERSIGNFSKFNFFFSNFPSTKCVACC